MRNYVPPDDSSDEPADYDFYYDVPAKSAKDLAARWYIKVERDPERAAYLESEQNAVIIELLKWAALQDPADSSPPSTHQVSDQSAPSSLAAPSASSRT